MKRAIKSLTILLKKETQKCQNIKNERQENRLINSLLEF